MALRVWLPLNGNLDNKGISDVTVTSSKVTIDNNGKIGQCYLINGKGSHIKCLFNNFNISEAGWSFCFWIYPQDLSRWNCLLSFVKVSGGNNFFYLNADGTFSYSAYSSSTPAYGDVESNKWQHIAISFLKTGGFAVYKNGEFLGVSRPETVWSDNLSGIKINNEDWGLFGDFKINDFRIYDHCLSAKEVKEISQGLVLHYKLDGFSGGSGRNLLRKPTTSTGYGARNELTTLTFSGWDKYADLDLVDIDWNNQVGKKLTYRCWLNNIEQTAGTGTGIMLHVRYADSTYQQYGGGKNGTTGSYLAQGESGWIFITITIPDPTVRTNPTTITKIQASIRHNSSGGASTVEYKNSQVELSDIPTTFGFAPEDVGIDITKVKDSSGYENDGEIVGDVITQSTSPRFNIATHLNSSSPTTNDNAGLTYIHSNFGLTTPMQMSVCWWAKPENGYGGTTNHAAWCTSISSSHPTDYNSTAFHHRDARFDICLNSASTTSTYLTFNNYTKNEWHYYCVVYDGKIAILYKDGVETNRNTISSTEAPLKTFSNIFIGYSRAGGVWRKTLGSYSDFRIYTTALSAEDILDLYHTSANIDNLHSLHSFEFVENNTDTIRTLKNGQFHTMANIKDNVWTGTQYNRSNMNVTYNFETDIFKDYGFNTAMRFTPTRTADGTTQFMAYSYICNASTVYQKGQDYTFSMYAYVSSDCNANFRINIEHSNTWTANYQGTTGNINDSTKGSVIKVWGKCETSASDGKMYIMFYFNPNQVDVFTQGYVLVAGLNVVLGDTIYPPSLTQMEGFNQDKNTSSIYQNMVVMNDFIEK